VSAGGIGPAAVRVQCLFLRHSPSRRRQERSGRGLQTANLQRGVQGLHGGLPASAPCSAITVSTHGPCTLNETHCLKHGTATEIWGEHTAGTGGCRATSLTAVSAPAQTRSRATRTLASAPLGHRQPWLQRLTTLPAAPRLVLGSRSLRLLLFCGCQQRCGPRGATSWLASVCGSWIKWRKDVQTGSNRGESYATT